MMEAVKKLSGAIALVVITLAFVAIGGFGHVTLANADKNHICVSDTIDATVGDNGALHVIDSRTYEFEGTYTLTAAVLDPPDRGDVIVNGVSVIDEAGNAMQLPQVNFVPSWRTSGAPSQPCFAVDTAYDTIYAFSRTTDAKKTFVFDYTYTNAITQYQDVSVLYWQFVGREWDVNTNNVNAYLHLPVPTGQSVEASKNVYAFGHGDLTGSVNFEDNGVIDFSIPVVKSGQFAEMRVAFPASWTPNVLPSMKVSSDGLPQVLEEEQAWERQAQVQRIIAWLMIIVPLVISLACLIVSIILFLRYGREHKPEFTGEYWRDVPEKGTNPAVIARLTRWDKEDANDLTAILMHLSNLGVVRLSRETQVRERKILADKEETVYHLELIENPPVPIELDAIDAEALRFVFDKIGGRTGNVTLDDIEAYAKNDAESYVNGMQRWQGTVSTAVARRNFFESAGEHCKSVFRIVASGLLLVGVFVAFMTDNFMPLIGLIPGMIALFVFSFFMPRRSAEAVEIQARCEALKRWFKDFTALDEAVPTDAKVWGELLVYAYIFGVAEQVVEDLNRVVPDIWNDSVFTYSMLWYYNPYGMAHMGAASAGFFGNAFDNTLNTAQVAIASAKGSGGGGFGGGGGFSMGGGGGFGGGGGGFSR